MPNSSNVLSVFIAISWRISGDVSGGLSLILSLAEAHACTLLSGGGKYNNLDLSKREGNSSCYSEVPYVA